MPTTVAQIKTFLPAILKESLSMGFFAEYYVYDSVNDSMIRKRTRLTSVVKRYRTVRERRLAAQELVEEINRKLSGGWSPLHQTEDSRLYTPIGELCKKFVAAKEREGIRPTTLTNYKSYTGLFLRWCEDTGRAKKCSGTFLRVDAVQYMDSLLDRGNGNRSYNNTMKALRCFWQWSLEHCYCKENPFAGLKLLPKTQKKRILVDAKTRQRVADYFRREKPQMLLVCQLVYSSAIRPKEISNIQIKHIDLDRHHILIEADNAKNGKARCATITRDIEDYIRPLLAKYPNKDYYLFGTGKQMVPSVSQARKNYFTKCWDKMRRELMLPEEMQLYSLRDTGLVDLLHAGVDQLSVQHHADHSSLAIQNIYTDHFDSGLNEKIYKNAPSF